jgi:hypothetical protein
MFLKMNFATVAVALTMMLSVVAKPLDSAGSNHQIRGKSHSLRNSCLACYLCISSKLTMI